LAYINGHFLELGTGLGQLAGLLRKTNYAKARNLDQTNHQLHIHALCLSGRTGIPELG
jgi:hypothetical protein